MKYRIILLSFILLGVSVTAQNIVDKQGRKQGHWIKTDKQGHKIFEGNFKDGKEVGVFEYYYGDGTIRLRNTWEGEDGKRCSHEAFDEKGRKLAQGSYFQHNRDGEWRYFSEKGNLVKIANYRVGVKDGLHVVFTSKGDTAEVQYWKDGKKQGRWWKLTGEKAYLMGNYNNGVLDGELKEYDDFGRLSHECTYVAGAKDGHSIYYSNGLKTIDETWQKGYFIDRKILILEGKTAHYYSIYRIAYLVPVGQQNKKVLVTLTDGSSFTATENPDDLYQRLGDELFSYVNRKNKVIAAVSCIEGLTKDSEGRDILKLNPNPSFVVFPDEDCLKLIQARFNEQQGVIPGE